MTNTTDAQAKQDHVEQTSAPETVPVPDADQESTVLTESAEAPEEVGGPKGPEPTRYGDWEKKGRCIDF